MAGLQYQDIVNAQGGTATNAQTGEVTTAPMTTINPQPTNPSAGQPVVINPVQTTGAPPLQLPQPDTNLATADATVTGSSQTAKTLQDYLNQLEAPKTALDGQNQALMDRLSSLYGSNVGRAQETAKLEDTSGLNTLKKQFADLNSQILTKNAEYLKLRDMTEQNSNLKGSFSAKDTQLARAQAADVGLLQARALGMQGQVSAAQDAIDRAINLKYQGIEEEITAKEKQMALIAPLLTAQQAKVAQAQERMYADEKERIAEEKAKAKENITLAMQAGVNTKFVNKNGEFFDVNSGVAYTDPQAFFKAAGVTSFEEAYKRGLITDLNNSKLADIQFAQQAQAKYSDVVIPPNATREQVIQAIQESAIYQKDTYMAPNGYTNPDGSPVVDNGGGQLYAGLSSATATAVRGQVAAFKTEPQVQNFATVQDGYNFSSSIDDNTKNPADDQALIYALAKALDPNSVVREGEYATAQKYAQSWVNAYGKGITQAIAGTGFLSLAARQNIKKTIETKYNSTKRTYDNLEKQYINSISSLTGRNDGSQFLKDYSNPSGSQVIEYNGKSYQTDEYGNFDENNPIGSNPLDWGDAKNSGGLTFNSAGNASASNQVKGIRESVAKLPLLNPDGSNKTPNLPITKVYPQGSYPSGKKGSLANQCGYFVRSVVNKMGLTYPTVGDTLKSKMASVKKYGSKIGAVGNVLITNESKQTGHVAYIIGKTAKGWILSESNYKLDGKINYGRVIPFNSPSIVGYLQPKKA